MTEHQPAVTVPAEPHTDATDGTDAKWWTLVAVCVGVFMLLLDITIVNVALPDIQSALDASLSDLQWVIDAYALTLAALLLTAGLAGRPATAAGCCSRSASSSSRSARSLCGAGQRHRRSSALARAVPGRRRRDHVRDLARAARARPSTGRERGVAFGVFGAITGRRGRRRPGARRRAHQRPLVALDLLRQHPDRHRRPRRHAAAQVDESRDPRAAAARLDRLRDLQRRRWARSSTA